MKPTKALISVFIVAVMLLSSIIVFAQEPCQGEKCDCCPKNTCCSSQTEKPNSVSSGPRCCVKSSTSVGDCCTTMTKDKTSKKDLSKNTTNKLTDMKMK